MKTSGIRVSNFVLPERLVTDHDVHPFMEEAMRYLCLIYENEKAWESMPPAESEAVMGEYFAFTEGIKAKGQFVAGEALHPTSTATTVRVRNGKISTTDGPYVETKEQLGGFYLVEAQDLNEAIQIASRIPSARYGGVEVRPVVDFSQEMAKQGQEGAGARA